jgi:hypothetical protein
VRHQCTRDVPIIRLILLPQRALGRSIISCLDPVEMAWSSNLAVVLEPAYRPVGYFRIFHMIPTVAEMKTNIGLGIVPDATWQGNEERLGCPTWRGPSTVRLMLWPEMKKDFALGQCVLHA